jgi:hypothetical protein
MVTVFLSHEVVRDTPSNQRFPSPGGGVKLEAVNGKKRSHMNRQFNITSPPLSFIIIIITIIITERNQETN